MVQVQLSSSSPSSSSQAKPPASSPSYSLARVGIEDFNPGRPNDLDRFVWGKLVMGIPISITPLLAIQVTSPNITHMASSAVRGVAASMLGLYVLPDIIPRCVAFPLFPSYKEIQYTMASGRATSIPVIRRGSPSTHGSNTKPNLNKVRTKSHHCPTSLPAMSLMKFNSPPPS
jgi:hypothetical protein